MLLAHFISYLLEDNMNNNLIECFTKVWQTSNLQPQRLGEEKR